MPTANETEDSLTTTWFNLRVALAAVSALLVGCATVLAAGGCAGFTARGHAVASASKTWSCPTDQISVVSESRQIETPPPADIAADPARLAIWQKNRPDSAHHRNVVLSGCGKTGVFQCNYEGYTDPGGGVAADWSCGGPFDDGTMAGTAAQLMTEAAAADARGDRAEAQRLRAKAQEFRSLRVNPLAPLPAPPSPAPEPTSK